MLEKSNASSAPRSDFSSSSRSRDRRSVRRRSKEMRVSQSTALVPKVAVVLGICGLIVAPLSGAPCWGVGGGWARRRSGGSSAAAASGTGEGVDDGGHEDQHALEVVLRGGPEPEERRCVEQLLEQQGAEERAHEGAAPA